MHVCVEVLKMKDGFQFSANDFISRSAWIASHNRRVQVNTEVGASYLCLPRLLPLSSPCVYSLLCIHVPATFFR